MLPRHPADRQTDITCECLGQRQAKQKLSVTLPLPKKRAHIASLFWACFWVHMVGQLRGLWFHSVPQGFARVGVARVCFLRTFAWQRPGRSQCDIASGDVKMRCHMYLGPCRSTMRPMHSKRSRQHGPRTARPVYSPNRLAWLLFALCNCSVVLPFRSLAQHSKPSILNNIT